MPLTPQQETAVYDRGGSLLVSAAAGSGKTKVLVERLFSYMEQEGCQVDDFLIITYTKAAAAELRGKIAQELTRRVADRPGDSHLRRQMLRVYQADIKTVDAFCAGLLRENVHLLPPVEEHSLTPDFRVLEDFYAGIEEDENARLLAETLGAGRDDRALEALVLDLHEKTQSHPHPLRWLEQLRQGWEVTPQELADTGCGRYLMEDALRRADFWSRRLTRAVEDMADYPAVYKAYGHRFLEVAQGLEALRAKAAGGWDSLAQGVPSFRRMGVAKGEENAACRERAKAVLEQAKKALKDIQAIFSVPEAELLEDLRQMAPAMLALLRLTAQFTLHYQAEKVRRNVMDFSDQEHYAIDLLTDGQGRPTELAKQVTSRYREVMVDEYQDSNQVQNCIFRALSGEERRLFAVGDVKQSIYRFRLAMPQIFMAKKDSYTPYNRQHPVFPAAITLDKNFRSRAGVCAYVNQVFSLFMTRRVGELDYTQSEYLNPFDSTPPDSVPHAALHILDAATGKDHGMDEPMAVAHLIAKKVQSGETVQDGDSRRPLRYGDFAILMRSMRAHAGDYAQALQDLHIPVVCDNATGLFENGEIQLLLSYLQVIDNPMQDIPLLAVLSSPIYGATADELAEIKLTAGHGRFYSAVFHPDNSCRPCCAALRKDLSFYKKLAVTMPVEAFIRRLIRDKSLFAYIRALGDGQQRQENVETFLSIAGRFDQNGGLGLAAFLRYVDSMIRGDGKTDSAPVIVTDENAVKIMSVHHSKGLEFPVCILAGAGRKYNMQDLTGKMLLHPQLGLATKCHQEEGYFDYPTLPLEVVKRESRLAAMSENLRVLYVAMTRAKSQFISFASVRSLESRVKTLAAYMQQGKPLPHLCSKLLYDSDFLLMSALCHPDGGALREMATVDVPVHPADFALQVVFHTPETEAPVQTAERETAADPRIVEQIREKLDYTYPYAALSKVSGKRNASALDEAVFTGAYVARSVPAFLQPDGLTPAEKGTAMHTFMQYCDYAAARADLEQEIARVQSAGYLRPEEAHALDRQKLTAFFTGPFGARVFGAKAVYRELKVASFLPVRALEQVDADDPVFVQGIADCVFEEPEGLVLLDYKTDRVKTEEELLARYRQQLMFYKTAVARTLQKPVHAVYLYSFCLSKPCEYK